MRLLMGISKNRHGTYYAIKKVPARLQEAVARVLDNGKAQQVWLKRSLGTKDANEANKRAKPVLIEFDHTLERAEALSLKRPLRTSLSHVAITRMAEYHYAHKLSVHDEYIRIAPEEELALRKAEPNEKWATTPAPDFGLSGGQMADAATALPAALQEAEAALAQGNIGHINAQLDQVLSAFQINLDSKSAAYRELGLSLLRAEVKAIRAIQKRFGGEPIETPTLSAVGETSPVTGETLRAALEGWKRQRDRPLGTLTEYERAISLFVELHGDLLVVQIKRSHARHFREALQDVPRTRAGKLLKAPLPELAQWGREHPGVQRISASTVNKLLGGVQAVGVWARDNGMVPDDVQWADPFSKMRLGEGDAVRGGAPFELTDLRVIFNSPVFTEGERPQGGQGEAAFWFPLLALFTGARLGELAGLRASEVTRDEAIGAVCLYITADAKAGKRLKTRKSARVIPVHPQLIKFGFLKFAALQAKARGGGAWLFPQVAPGTKGAKAFSKWFGRYIGAHGVTDAAKVFYSFRHNFIDALRGAGVAGEINTSLVGHSEGGVHAKYGAKEIARRFGKRLSEAVARVRYAGLDLSHLTNHRAPKSRRRSVKTRRPKRNNKNED